MATELLPLRVENRLMRQAEGLNADVEKQVKRVRYDPKTPSRSFIGEIFNGLVNAYNLGRQSRWIKCKKCGAATTVGTNDFCSGCM